MYTGKIPACVDTAILLGKVGYCQHSRGFPFQMAIMINDDMIMFFFYHNDDDHMNMINDIDDNDVKVYDAPYPTLKKARSPNACGSDQRPGLPGSPVRES